MKYVLITLYGGCYESVQLFDTLEQAENARKDTILECGWKSIEEYEKDLDADCKDLIELIVDSVNEW